MKNPFLKWCWDRLGENSTWRGITLLLTVLGCKLNPDQQSSILAAGLAIVGLINVFRSSSTPGGQFNPQAEVRRAEKV